MRDEIIKNKGFLSTKLLIFSNPNVREYEKNKGRSLLR
jgi:hypothetical protein